MTQGALIALVVACIWGIIKIMITGLRFENNHWKSFQELWNRIIGNMLNTIAKMNPYKCTTKLCLHVILDWHTGASLTLNLYLSHSQP